MDPRLGFPRVRAVACVALATTVLQAQPQLHKILVLRVLMDRLGFPRVRVVAPAKLATMEARLEILSTPAMAFVRAAALAPRLGLPRTCVVACVASAISVPPGQPRLRKIFVLRVDLDPQLGCLRVHVVARVALATTALQALPRLHKIYALLENLAQRLGYSPLLAVALAQQQMGITAQRVALLRVVPCALRAINVLAAAQTAKSALQADGALQEPKSALNVAKARGV